MSGVEERRIVRSDSRGRIYLGKITDCPPGQLFRAEVDEDGIIILTPVEVVP